MGETATKPIIAADARLLAEANQAICAASDAVDCVIHGLTGKWGKPNSTELDRLSMEDGWLLRGATDDLLVIAKYIVETLLDLRIAANGGSTERERELVYALEARDAA